MATLGFRGWVMDRRRLIIGAAALGATALAGPAFAAFKSDRISVITEGDGPDVILIHGLSSSRDVWRGLVDRMKGRYRFHLVQIGGYAGAPVGANASGLVAAPVAEEVARYISESKLNRPAVIGHSMGGSIGLMLAARHPDLVGRLMVVDMMPYLGVLFAKPGSPPEVVKKAADDLSAAMLAATPEDYAKRQAASIDSMVQTKTALPALVEHGRTSDKRASVDAFHELIVTDLTPELPRITAPVTILYVHTPAYPITPEMLDVFYKQAYAGVPKVKLVRIPDAWHFLMIDQPDRFAQEVTAFLAG
jgi:pimeloyl-ACP methyl ester carboxylesterase